MRAAVGCVRCDGEGTTVVVELSAVTVYLDLCERHLTELLRDARPADVGPPAPLHTGRGSIEKKGSGRKRTELFADGKR